MNKKTFTPKNMAYCSAGAALLAVSSWITIPLGALTFTMQSFAVFLILGTFGGRRGTLSILIWLLLGAAGVPVFSSFRGGAGVLLGVTGGYIWGFLGAGLLFWALTARFPGGAVAAMALGMLLCYVCGSLWFRIAYAGEGGVSLWAVVLRCVVPYLLPDALKIALAGKLSARLKKAAPFRL